MDSHKCAKDSIVKYHIQPDIFRAILQKNPDMIYIVSGYDLSWRR